MGEVYRARDTRLARDVALKILPEAFAADPERRARFEREATTLAALNHPNIAQVHGFEDSGPIRAIVLELVDGEDLARRLARGALPIRDALPIARQIADALEAAHEQGIIHRDLKPANVKVRADGTVKVLDFGLAKALLREGPAPDLSQSPTITVDGTRAGVILGTAAYMSPEQSRGHVVDKRTDIWAFGCVLYEMLTGRAAFAAATVSDTIARILERDVDWSALPSTAPAAVRELIECCLTKDVRHRLRDIGDARIALEATERAPRASQRATPRPRRLAWIAGAAAAIAVAAVAALMLQRSGLQPQPSAPALGPLTRLTSDTGYTGEPSISRNGALVSYASDRSGDGNLDIWVQQSTGGPAIRLTNDPTDDHQPDVSPDGSLIAFRSERDPAGVYVVPALGGDPRLIARDGRWPRFSPDGRRSRSGLAPGSRHEAH